MERKNAAEVIVEAILNMLEKGVSPWHQPWKNGAAVSVNGNVYRGINAILLSFQPYEDNRWITYKRAIALGGRVKKGEKSFPVVFWSFIEKKEKNEKGEIEIKKVPLLRYYNVFNVEQCEGLELPENPVFNSENSPIEEAEKVWEGYENKPSLTFNKSLAYYSPAGDYISIPQIEQFCTSEEYYGTLFHEAVHSTGAKNRLNRFTNADTFGSESYGKEELIAEIGAQILCQSVGITRTLENAAAYCKSWCKAIKEMPAISIVSAAGQAQKAADLILGIKEENAEENAEE